MDGWHYSLNRSCINVNKTVSEVYYVHENVFLIYCIHLAPSLMTLLKLVHLIANFIQMDPIILQCMDSHGRFQSMISLLSNCN